MEDELQIPPPSAACQTYTGGNTVVSFKPHGACPPTLYSLKHQVLRAWKAFSGRFGIFPNVLKSCAQNL